MLLCRQVNKIISLEAGLLEEVIDLKLILSDFQGLKFLLRIIFLFHFFL